MFSLVQCENGVIMAEIEINNTIICFEMKKDNIFDDSIFNQKKSIPFASFDDLLMCDMDDKESRSISFDPSNDVEEIDANSIEQTELKADWERECDVDENGIKHLTKLHEKKDIVVAPKKTLAEILREKGNLNTKIPSKKSEQTNVVIATFNPIPEYVPRTEEEYEHDHLLQEYRKKEETMAYEISRNPETQITFKRIPKPFPLTGKFRKELSNYFKKMFNEYKAHKNIGTLNKDIEEFATSYDTLFDKKNQFAFGAVTYLVALHRHEIIRKNSELMLLLRALTKQTDAEKDYFLISSCLTETPFAAKIDKESENIGKYREIISNRHDQMMTYKLLKEMNAPFVPFVERQFIVAPPKSLVECVNKLEQNQFDIDSNYSIMKSVKSYVSQMNSFIEQLLNDKVSVVVDAKHEVQNLPISDENAIETEKVLTKYPLIADQNEMKNDLENFRNVFYRESWYGSVLTNLNRNYWLQIWFSAYCPKMIEVTMEFLNVQRKEKQELVIFSLQDLVTGISSQPHLKNQEITREKIKEMLNWLDANVSHHLLGAYEEKQKMGRKVGNDHTTDTYEIYPVSQKLLEMKSEGNELAQMVFDEIEKLDPTRIIYALSDNIFIKKEKYWGPLGLHGLHQHCYKNHCRKYLSRLFSEFEKSGCGVKKFVDDLAEMLVDIQDMEEEDIEEMKRELCDDLYYALMKHIKNDIEKMIEMCNDSQGGNSPISFKKSYKERNEGGRLDRIFQVLKTNSRTKKQTEELVERINDALNIH
jgi:hypothetical protein